MKSLISTYPLLYIFILLLMFSTSSCEDVVDVNLEQGEPRLVVDAEILWLSGTTGENQTIYLSRLTDYYNTEVTRVSGATVTIKNENNKIFYFTETETPGSYTCTNFDPEIGGNYTLNVIVDGEVYTATESLIASPEVTRIEQYEDGGFLGEDKEVRFYYNDPEEETNFYLADFQSDVLNFPEYDLSSDDFFNGNEMYQNFSHEDLETGSEIDITFRAISEQFHDYMELILESAVANPFGTPPANIRGNLLNETNPENFAFGYFRLSQGIRFRYTIQ